MWSSNDAMLTSLAVILLIVIAYYVERTNRQVRLTALNQKRLSITFLKIENDLAAIQDSLVMIGAAQGDETASAVNQIRNRRPSVLRFTLEGLQTSAELLRGLELPDPEEDPAFGKDDLMKRLGLEENLIAAQDKS